MSHRRPCAAARLRRRAASWSLILGRGQHRIGEGEAGHLGQKPARSPSSVVRESDRAGPYDPDARPAHGGVGETAFLLDAEAAIRDRLHSAREIGGVFRATSRGTQVGQHTLAGVGDEDDVELHAFGLVQRRQRDPIVVAATK